MATDDKGSDLDVFEGLVKKPASILPSAPPGARSAVPPPPPGMGDTTKRTLVGVPPPLIFGVPPAPPAMSPLPPPAATPYPSGAPHPSSSPMAIASPPPQVALASPAPAPLPSPSPAALASPAPAAFPSPAPVPLPSPAPIPVHPPIHAVPSVVRSSTLGRTPPPPPGRSDLPEITTPSGSSIPLAAKTPEAEATRPAVVDVNWDDDEDETTHIFDKAEDLVVKSRPAPVPAAGTPPPPAVAKNKVTLLGINPGPLPPLPGVSPLPTARLTPPPGAQSTRPGPGQNPFTVPSSFPAPPISNLPPPPTTQQGLGGHPSVPPPIPAPLEMPHTSPLPPASMPPPRRSHESLRAPPNPEATAILKAPKPQSKATLWAASALVAALLLALAFLLIPQTGRLIVDVNVPKGASANRVDIFVDGRKQCDTAPCIIDPLSSGTHEVKVVAEGYDTPPIQNVTIAARHDTSATFALDMGIKHTELKVSGAQPGVKLFVDDKEIGPLPQDLRDFAPGDHVIRLVGSERYQPVEKHITFQPDSVVDLGAIALKVSKGKATVSLATPGAHVYLTSVNDRRELPMFPISVDIDTSKTWTLQASKFGFNDYSQVISFDDGQAEKTYAIELTAKTMAYAPPAWTPPPPPAAAPAPPSPPPPPPAAAAPVAARPAPESNGSEAFLNINSIPASNCFLDGRALGSTPKINVSVKPGTHTVKFVNTEQGLTKTVTVNVGAGETKPAVAKLN